MEKKSTYECMRTLYAICMAGFPALLATINGSCFELRIRQIYG